MKRKLVIAIAVLGLLSIGVVSAQVRNPSPAQKAAVPTGTGTVQYDPGAPADSFIGQLGASNSVGNRFSSRNGNPLSPGSISFISVYVDLNVGGGGLFAFWGPPAGTGASYIAGAALSGLVNNTFNGFAVGPVPVGSDFMGALYLNTGQPSRGQIGMRSATTNGQGFHAMQISFNGGAGANYASIADSNAMARVTGSVIVPVELMEFDVE